MLIACLCMPCLSTAATDSAEADFIPWSGYWWPTTGGGLANGYGRWGHPAPIEKYELLTNGRYPGEATQWELRNFYDPDAPSWFGQCYGWAAAAAFEDMDFFPSSYENIVFRVGDKKGLMTACHGDDPSVRTTGDEGPHVFHEWLLFYIKENARPFVADLGGPDEAWFYPIYKYELNTEESGNVVHVTCQVWYADDRVDPDFQGTRVLAAGFTYDLYVQGSGEITGGEWTGGSVSSHPGSIFFPLSAQPANPYLDYETIREIALHKDDFLEDGVPVRLLPGTYNLILLNEDVYTVECRAGETICLDMAPDDYQEGISIRIADAGGAPVLDSYLEGGVSTDITAENPPYTLTFSMEDYGGGGIYTLQFNLKKAHEFLCPRIQKGSGWNGFALTNLSAQPCTDIQVVSLGETGGPVATITGPLTLGPGEKKTFLLSDLPIRPHEESSVFSIRIMADQDALSVVYLGGLEKKSMLGFGRKREGRRLIVPDTSSMFDAGKYVSWGLYNPEIDPLTANLSLFSAEGWLQKEAVVVLEENSLSHYTPSNNPFNKNLNNGWILIEADGLSGLGGNIEWTRDGSGGVDSMFALTSPGTWFLVPHVAQGWPWSTHLILINVSDTQNQVSLWLVDGQESYVASLGLAPFEKQSIQTVDLFPALDMDTLNRSSLIITSQREITGCFSYKTGSSSAYYPLAGLEEIAPVSAIPHVASDDLWWTSLAIFNPWGLGVKVHLIPYNDAGAVIPGGLKHLTLPPRKKAAYSIRDLFGPGLAGQVAWVKIYASGKGICGLFLYGDHGTEMISGFGLY